jgi:lycopene beta-cyclase
MTDHKFPEWEGNIIYLGTAGGKTKSSSGYTYRFIQKHVETLVTRLEVSGDPFIGKNPLEKRFLLSKNKLQSTFPENDSLVVSKCQGTNVSIIKESC